MRTPPAITEAHHERARRIFNDDRACVVEVRRRVAMGHPGSTPWFEVRCPAPMVRGETPSRGDGSTPDVALDVAEARRNGHQTVPNIELADQLAGRGFA